MQAESYEHPLFFIIFKFVIKTVKQNHTNSIGMETLTQEIYFSVQTLDTICFYVCFLLITYINEPLINSVVT